MLDDPFEPIASYFLGKLKEKILQSWIRLLFQMALSALITGCLTFSVIGAAAVLSTHSASIGLALALCASFGSVAIVLTNWFRTAPETKGMRLVIPASEALQEMNTDLQTIERK